MCRTKKKVKELTRGQTAENSLEPGETAGRMELDK